MEVVVQIGPDTADTAVVVTISGDDWMPDQLTDACNRARDTALRLHHDLHPASDG